MPRSPEEEVSLLSGTGVGDVDTSLYMSDLFIVSGVAFAISLQWSVLSPVLWDITRAAGGSVLTLGLALLLSELGVVVVAKLCVGPLSAKFPLEKVMALMLALGALGDLLLAVLAMCTAGAEGDGQAGNGEGAGGEAPRAPPHLAHRSFPLLVLLASRVLSSCGESVMGCIWVDLSLITTENNRWLLLSRLSMVRICGLAVGPCLFLLFDLFHFSILGVPLTNITTPPLFMAAVMLVCAGAATRLQEPPDFHLSVPTESSTTPSARASLLLHSTPRRVVTLGDSDDELDDLDEDLVLKQPQPPSMGCTGSKGGGGGGSGGPGCGGGHGGHGGGGAKMADILLPTARSAPRRSIARDHHLAAFLSLSLSFLVPFTLAYVDASILPVSASEWGNDPLETSLVLSFTVLALVGGALAAPSLSSRLADRAFHLASLSLLLAAAALVFVAGRVQFPVVGTLLTLLLLHAALPAAAASARCLFCRVSADLDPEVVMRLQGLLDACRAAGCALGLGCFALWYRLPGPHLKWVEGQEHEHEGQEVVSSRAGPLAGVGPGLLAALVLVLLLLLAAFRTLVDDHKFVCSTRTPRERLDRAVKLSRPSGISALQLRGDFFTPKQQENIFLFGTPMPNRMFKRLMRKEMMQRGRLDSVIEL